MNTSVVGIDIGYGDVKIVSDDLLAVDDTGCLVSFPTLITPARDTHFKIMDKTVTPIEVDGEKYLIGEDAREAMNVLDTKYETWFKENIYLAFFKKALSYVAPGPIHVVTGLPVSEYDKWHAELKKRLTGEFKVNGNVYEVLSVRVMPQPFGSFSNYIYDTNGRLMNEEALEESVGIIDIGNRTTDFILVDSGKWVAEGASGTITIGVSNLFEKIAEQVSENYKVSLTPLKLRESLRSRQIKVYGVVTNIGHIIDREVDFFVKYIEHTSKTHWGSGGHIDTVLLVGGGAEIFRKYIDKIFPHIAVPKDPGFSNAKGFFKYGMSKAI